MNLRNEIDKQANLWIIKQNEGFTQEEQKELERWLENAHYKQAFEENKRLIDECLKLDEDFIKELDNEVLNETTKINFFAKSKYLIASIVIACITAIGAFEIDKYFIPTFSQDYLSTNEKILNIALPDNSIIDLDKKSQLKIRYYQTKRVIELQEGNAFFSVAKEKQKPFLVQTKDTLIEVLGTKFEVITFNNKTRINVLEGLVQVSYLDTFRTKALVQLKRAESLVITNLGDVLSQNKIDVTEVASWKRDIIQFNKTTLKDATAMFERYSNDTIEFDNQGIANLRISGKFSTLHFNSFLDSMALIYPINVKKEGDKVKIVRK